MPYRVAGVIVHESKAQVLLAKGDRVFTVQQGDSLENGYRVESIEANGVKLLYTPLGAVQKLSFASLLAPQAPPTLSKERWSPPQEQAAVNPGPAQLRWQGPERVYAGSPFEVVLKLTSAQPVRSSPLELSYDAKLLEAVAIRGGDLFADGKLSYRVTPTGSILIGASSADAVGADIDFLVLTFKAIRGNATAELSLSSIELKDSEGSAITYKAPAAFQTSILR